MIEVKIIGLEKLKDELKFFAADVEKRIIASGLAAGARLVVNEAKAKVPTSTKPHYFYPHRKRGRIGRAAARRLAREQGTLGEGKVLIKPGNIRRNIRARRLKAQAHELWYRVGPMKSGRSIADDPWYWKFLEFGTKQLRATPFLRPAFHDNANRIIDEIRKRLLARVVAENKKLARLAG